MTEADKKVPNNPLRILVVEDEPFIAMEIQSDLEALGHNVLGPVDTAGEAQLIAMSAEFDVALLDIQLRNEESFVTAKILQKRKIPFSYVTAYQWSLILQTAPPAPVLSKPFTTEQLHSMVNMLASAAEPAKR